MKFAKTIAFHLLAIVVSTILAATLLMGSLKLIDNHLLSHRRPNFPDEDAGQPTMRTMEDYPFTGGQIQAYMRERGKLLWSDYYSDFDVVSGEYGFFIDFRLAVCGKIEKLSHRVGSAVTVGVAPHSMVGGTLAV